MIDICLQCKLTDGQLTAVIPEKVQYIVKELIENCTEKHGGYVRIQISPPYKKRSTNQNSAFHAGCSHLGGYLGMSLEETKIEIKQRAVSKGYPVLRDCNGEILINPLTGRPYPLSSTKVNTVEMGILMDTLQEVAAFAGVLLEYK